jgi:ABC-type branched-subunit amino acid transport system ATPase component
LFDNIDMVHEDGTATLINEQNVGTLLERADYGYPLAEGKTKHRGVARERRDTRELPGRGVSRPPSVGVA